MLYLFDGAMGTMLQQAGLPAGYCPELWNLERQDIITSIHREYVLSGADIIETNTFGANRIKLTVYGLEDKVAMINQAAVRAARLAAGSATKIAGSVGPTGKLISPLGDLDFDAAYTAFYEQIVALDQAGIDYLIIETIIDMQEMRAALLAAKAATSKPIICQLSFGEAGRTVTGTDPCTAAQVLSAMGASVIGANCSLGPEKLLNVVQTLALNTNCPISVQPNAGMPKLVGERTVFPLKPEEFAQWVPQFVAAGASFLGGCCGTTPAHIKEMRAALSKVDGSFLNNQFRAKTALTSRTKTLFIGQDFPTTVIGERINPTGRKALTEDIRNGQFLLVKQEALKQVQAGAGILDVNLGVPGINQAAAMQTVVRVLSMLTDTPLALDTTDPSALEAGLKAFPGRALVNSVSAEPEQMASFLPLAKKYGAAILCLPIAPSGVPETATERLTIVKHIVEAALAYGLEPHDLLLDTLVLTIAVTSSAAAETIKTLKLYKQHFGCPTVMGVSNISYGLPKRELLNAVFCNMALEAGLDAPILNPCDLLMQEVIAARHVLTGQDANANVYCRHFSNHSQPTENKTDTTGDVLLQIQKAIVNGEEELAAELTQKAVTAGYTVQTITEQALTKAMNQVGEAFDLGRCFLPQVMLSAEAMQASFKVLKVILPVEAKNKLGTIVLATVKGDIHDLGKNIAAALLESNGFNVVDLGKDVAPQTIVKAAIVNKADVVGLCALMTTTLPEMNKTIRAIKTAEINSSILVGGAVITGDYAKEVGADAYAANGIEVVRQAKRLLKAKI